MLLLECPYCGAKCEETELSPGGEAHIKRYGPGSSDQDFEAYLFMRETQKACILNAGVMSMAVASGSTPHAAPKALRFLAPMRPKPLNPHKRSKTKSAQNALVGHGGISHEHAFENRRPFGQPRKPSRIQFLTANAFSGMRAIRLPLPCWQMTRCWWAVRSNITVPAVSSHQAPRNPMP